MLSITPVSRAQALADAIEQAIVDDALIAGDHLGTLEHWQRRSGFARATVNEAMRLLVDRGIAEIRPGRGGGIFAATGGGIVRLRHTLLSVRGRATTVVDSIIIREALEPLILTDAARSRTKASMREVHNRLAQLKTSAGAHSEFIRANWALHASIAQITPNEMLRTMYLETLQSIRDNATEATSDVAPAENYQAHRVAVHVELVEAIESGDLDRLKTAIREHARETRP